MDIELLAREYKVGDRVRVLVKSEKIADGTKGNVESILNGVIAVKAKVEGEEVTEFFHPDQIEQVISLRAGTGEMQRTRKMYGVDYAGTNLPEELIQIHQHFIDMIEAGYSYLYMERWLMSNGYGFNMIRRSFHRLTGIRAEDAVGFEYQYSPGNIPQFTLGWGEKKKGGGTCFVMPGVNWYSIFHQVDDMLRLEIEKHAELSDAIDSLRKMVKKLYRWDPPVREMDLPKKHVPGVEPSQLYKQQHLFMQADSAVVSMLKSASSPRECRRMIYQAYLDGHFDEAARDWALKTFADAEEDAKSEAAMERLDEVEQDQMKQPISDELAEKTPQQYFERKKIEHRYSVLPANVVAAVIEYINNASARLRDFDLAVHSLKFSTIQPAGTKQSMPGDQPDIMNSTASVSILLEIIDKKTEEDQNRKLGMMVFSVIRDNIFTTDTVKGEDDWIYAVTDEGLAKYFDAERQLAVGRK